eukprot:COSAG06_NODE_1151_length_10496_cov_14.282004_10_plen_48_part_00
MGVVKDAGMVAKEGYLMKKSPGMLKMWQRRWFGWRALSSPTTKVTPR